jgi:hypothetical protein
MCTHAYHVHCACAINENAKGDPPWSGLSAAWAGARLDVQRTLKRDGRQAARRRQLALANIEVHEHRAAAMPD